MCAQSCLTLCTPWTVAHQAPLSTEFPKQEYQNGLPFPSLGNLVDPGIKPVSPALAGRLFTLHHQGSTENIMWVQYDVSAWQLPIWNFCFEVVGRQHFRQMNQEGRQAEVILRPQPLLTLLMQEAELCKVDK